MAIHCRAAKNSLRGTTLLSGSTYVTFTWLWVGGAVPEFGTNCGTVRPLSGSKLLFSIPPILCMMVTNYTHFLRKSVTKLNECDYVYPDVSFTGDFLSISEICENILKETILLLIDFTHEIFKYLNTFKIRLNNSPNDAK